LSRVVVVVVGGVVVVARSNAPFGRVDRAAFNDIAGVPRRVVFGVASSEGQRIVVIAVFLSAVRDLHSDDSVHDWFL